MIEEIKRIFDDIRDGIIEMGGDIDMCTSPEEYAEAIKGLSGNNAVLFIPCFKASETKPETPVKTMSPVNPTDYPDGGGTPDGLTGKIWMTYTVVSVSTTYVPGTEPVLLGAAGESPTPPVYEPQVTRTFVICMELPDAEITPNIPTGGKGDVDNNVLLGTIEYPSEQYTIESILSNGNTAGWSCNNTHTSGGFTWMSVGTFLAENGSQVGSGSDPMCINSARDGVDGHDGRNGVDGTDIEFIYKLFHSKEAALAEQQPESNPNIDDYIPGPNPGQKGYGTDSPLSIDPDEYPVEVMCQRKKNVVDPNTGNKVGGAFVGPVIWSSGGEDGMDGDGVEYIFRVATNAEVTQDANGKYHLNDIATGPPTCGDDCANAFYTVAAGHGYTREQLTEIYQQNDFVPGSDISHPRPTIEAIGGDRNGTDDPRDVDINEPFEFVSIRKYDGETGTGGWFSAPVLWNKYYVTSAPIFTSYAFCRSTKNLGSMVLSGGTVLNPLPSDQTVDGELIHWYDGIPGATEYGAESTRAKAPIGMTSSKFGSADPTVVIAPDGTSPVLMADNKFFNVEYSASDTFTTPLPKFDAYLPGVVSGKDYPFIDNTNPEGVDEATGRSYCTSHGYGTGGDTVTNPKGMATCTFENGHGTDGTVTQIEGEVGADGPGVEYVYVRTTSAVAPTVRSKNSSIPIVDTNGHTYVDDEFLPLASGGALQNDTQCTDDPIGVNATYQYEGIAKRVKVFASGSTTTRVWEEYTGPMSLWAKGGEQGAPGNDGLNQATVTLYKAAESVPAVPSTTTTYTFATGVLSGTLDGGSQTMPSVSGSNVCGVTQAKAISSTSTVSIATGDWSNPRQLTGTRGPIGPKMRMRNWKTDYPDPDTEGQTGWLNGDGAADAFYDIAIYPVADEGITVTNASSNANRLGRCIQPLPYTTLTTIISQAGDASSVYPGSTYLQGYFSQAVGWDFVATSLLLANRISANQIDVDGLSAKTIVTDVTDGSYASVQGNTIELRKSGGITKCKISGNPITLSVNSSQTPVGNAQLGEHFVGGAFNQGISKTIDLGTFEITQDVGAQRDVLYSSNNNVLGIHFIGKVKSGVTGNTTHDIGVYGHIKLSAINTNTGNYTTGYQTNYGETSVIVPAFTSLTPGNTNQYHMDAYTLQTNQAHQGEFAIGTYRLVLNIDLVDVGMSEYFEDMYIYLNQDNSYPSDYGQFYPVINHHSTASDLQYTDIGTDGLAHVLDGDNYFFIQKQSGNTLKLEFLSNALYGLKIDSTGIYYTKTGPSGGSSNGASLNS